MEDSIIDQGSINLEHDETLPQEAKTYLKEANSWKLFIAVCLIVLGSLYTIAGAFLAFTALWQSRDPFLMPMVIVMVVAVTIFLPGYFLYISTRNHKRYFQSGSNHDFNIALESDKRFWKIAAIYSILQAAFISITSLIAFMS